MVLTKHQKAYTTARVGAMRVGATRIAYAPRCTNGTLPDGTGGLPSFYVCHKREEKSESGTFDRELEP